MKHRFKKNDFVLVDPENRVRDRMIQGTLTGIIIKAGLFRSKVFSLETHIMITMPNKYLYNMERASTVDFGHIALIRDNAPLFSLSEIIELEAVMGELNSDSSKNIIKNVIMKAQDHMIGNVFLEVEMAKSDTHTFLSVPSVINRYLTDDVFEQLENCVEARSNLDLAKEAGAFEKEKEKFFKREVEMIFGTIATAFKEKMKEDPDTEVFTQLFADLLNDNLEVGVILDILTMVIPLIPRKNVNSAFVALNDLRAKEQSEEMKDVINMGMSMLRAMGATVAEYDDEEDCDEEEDE